jgi:hypothetical protein
VSNYSKVYYLRHAAYSEISSPRKYSKKCNVIHQILCHDKEVGVWHAISTRIITGSTSFTTQLIQSSVSTFCSPSLRKYRRINICTHCMRLVKMKPIWRLLWEMVYRPLKIVHMGDEASILRCTS